MLSCLRRLQFGKQNISSASAASCLLELSRWHGIALASLLHLISIASHSSAIQMLKHRHWHVEVACHPWCRRRHCERRGYAHPQQLGAVALQPGMRTRRQCCGTHHECWYIAERPGHRLMTSGASHSSNGIGSLTLNQGLHRTLACVLPECMVCCIRSATPEKE